MPLCNLMDQTSKQLKINRIRSQKLLLECNQVMSAYDPLKMYSIHSMAHLRNVLECFLSRLILYPGYKM
jgi:hypothetical protein